jgi:hypothetical protein
MYDVCLVFATIQKRFSIVLFVHLRCRYSLRSSCRYAPEGVPNKPHQHVSWSLDRRVLRCARRTEEPSSVMVAFDGWSGEELQFDLSF